VRGKGDEGKVAAESFMSRVRGLIESRASSLE
jgi:hypothetical protein